MSKLKTDKPLVITDRQVGNLREKISRVQRNIKLFRENNDEKRLITAINMAIEIDKILCSL